MHHKPDWREIYLCSVPGHGSLDFSTAVALQGQQGCMLQRHGLQGAYGGRGMGCADGEAQLWRVSGHQPQPHRQPELRRAELPPLDLRCPRTIVCAGQGQGWVVIYRQEHRHLHSNDGLSRLSRIQPEGLKEHARSALPGMCYSRGASFKLFRGQAH